MSVYVAILLCEATSTAEDHAPLYQENFVLLTAQDEEEACARRLRTASAWKRATKTTSGKPSPGDSVMWWM